MIPEMGHIFAEI